MTHVTGPGYWGASLVDPEQAGSRVLHKGRQVGVGIYDGLSALMSAKADFDFLWLGSFGVSAAIGHPDNGILEAETMIRLAENLRTLVSVPLVIDMDSGYGDAAKVSYAVQRLAFCGAAAVCLEDYTNSKRSSLYVGYERRLATVEEHSDKITSAVSAARPHGCAVIARTEALVAGMGLAHALARAEAYVEAGADAVFVQAVEADEGDSLLSFLRAWDRRTRVFIAPTCYPFLRRTAFFDAGASHYIFANHLIRGVYRLLAELSASLIGAEHSNVTDDTIATVGELASFLGERGVVPENRPSLEL